MKNTVRRIAFLLALALLVGVMTAAAAAEYTGERIYVDGRNSAKVHLRSQPSTESASLGLVYTGTEVILVFPENAEWYMVQLGAETGYISSAYLSREQPETQAPVAYVNNPNSSWSNLRKGASTQSQSVGRMDNGEVVYVLAELKNGWSYVQRGAQAGFVLTGFLQSDIPSAPTQGEDDDALGTPVQQLMNAAVEKVGNAANCDGIFRLIAPDNGQTLFFTSAVEKPAVYQQDVDFDGTLDLVVTTNSGASNQYHSFFLRRGYEYVQVEVPGWGYELCNYQLYPQRRLVVTHANNGAAGAFHETTIFCWNGTQLKPLRTAEAHMSVDDYDQNGLIISAANPQLVSLTVWDYTSNEESNLIYEKTVLLAAMQTELELQLDVLWQGLK